MGRQKEPKALSAAHFAEEWGALLAEHHGQRESCAGMRERLENRVAALEMRLGRSEADRARLVRALEDVTAERDRFEALVAVQEQPADWPDGRINNESTRGAES